MENSRRLVCVGRLSEQKGQLLLVEAAGKLTREGIEFELDLIGDGPMRGEIEGLIRRLKIERHVRLLGWKSGVEVCQAMLASRAMVLPSFAEGLPVVIMEALALGRPVISTYIAGTPELVEPGVNGWLVPAGSVVALVTAMREALETPLDKLTTMGEAGAKRVAEQHHAATEAKKLAKLFEEAIEGRKLSSGPRANPPARREGEEAEPVSLVGR